MDLFKLVGTISINAGEATQTIDGFMVNVGQLNTTLQGTQTETNKTATLFGKGGKFSTASVWLGNTFSKLTSKITSTALNWGKSIVNTGINYNKAMEKYSATFTSLTGDAESAQKLIADIWKLAADTPYDMVGLASNAENLMRYGVEAENVIDILRMLGDVALGDKDKLYRLTVGFGQMWQKGQLYAEESKQLVENGFPLYDALGAIFPNKTTQDILEMRKDGEISNQHVLDALRWATTEGNFQNASENMMATTSGQFEKLKDNWSQAWGTFIAPFYEEAGETVFPRLITLMEKFFDWCTENEDIIANFAKSIGEFAVDALTAFFDVLKYVTENPGTVSDALTGIAIAFTAITTAINPAKGALLLLIEAIMLIVDNWEKVKFMFGFKSSEDRLRQYADAGMGTEDHSTVPKIARPGTLDAQMHQNLMENEDILPIPENWARMNPDGTISPATPKITRPSGTEETEMPDLGSYRHNTNLTGFAATLANDISNMFDTSGVEGALHQTNALLAQIAGNTSAGNTVVLDSGALVGQMIPQIDSAMGAIVRRKGRG